MKTLIIIPSRLSATRLPGKPLLKVNGLSITVNGDAVADHPVLHTGIKTANGSSTVKAGGIGINRTGDADTCSTHSRVGGSGNVNIG